MSSEKELNTNAIVGRLLEEREFSEVAGGGDGTYFVKSGNFNRHGFGKGPFFKDEQ